MTVFAPYSTFTMDSVVNNMGAGLSQQETQLNSELAQLANNPNPSQADLLVFQTNLQMWTSLIQMESSVVKVYGDTMKQVVTNMGS